MNNSYPFQSTIEELASLGEKNKKLEKALNAHLKNIQKRADEEKESINQILSILSGKAPESSKKVKKTREKRIKLTDDEIISKLNEILSGGVKLSKSEIQSKIGVQLNRFKLFLQNHPDLLGHEGKNKTSRWFLK
jgi:hypothetical protein